MESKKRECFLNSNDYKTKTQKDQCFGKYVENIEKTFFLLSQEFLKFSNRKVS